MIQWLFKKIKKYMYDIDALAQTRDFIMGKDYQWVNTPDDSKVAKIVKVQDVFSRGGLIAAKLNDGSTVSIDELNTKLMVIMDNQEPLTRAECLSIRGPVLSDKAAETYVAPAEPVAAPIAATPQASPVTETTGANLFSMFATEESLLALSLRVNLPSTNLLKMMYQSSQNKSDFLNQLANHINNQITPDHIKDALLKKLEGKK
jgi:hypothetical protein